MALKHSGGSHMAFFFAAQVEWVPYLSHSPSSSSSSSSKNPAEILLEDGSLSKSASHIPISISDSQSPSIPATAPSSSISTSSATTGVHDDHVLGTSSNDNNAEQDLDTVIDDGDTYAKNDTIDQHGHDPVLSPLPSPANEDRTESLQLDGNKEHNPFLTMFPSRPPTEGEKFLAYLPHSGFHNQLITLENALRLAAYLNRTLLLPPLYLSHKRQALLWKEPPVLLQQWADRNRTDVDYCREIDPTVWPRKTRKQKEAMSEEERKMERECGFYHTWTSTPWTYFYDIPKILTGVMDAVPGQGEPIRVFSRPVMSLAWLEDHLNIQDPISEIYFFNDTSRYAYRIVDDSETDYGIKPETEQQREAQEMELMTKEGLTPSEVQYRTRYEHEILLTDLQKRPEKVIHFGSLFATDRVEARSEKHLALQSFISHGMDLWNQAILDATTLAEEQMEAWRIQTGRASPGFLGVHLRTEDGIFEKLSPRNLQRIVAWLGEMVKRDRTRYLKGSNDGVKRATVQLGSTPVYLQQNDAEPTFLERCMGSSSDSPMVFMATDIHQPRHAPLLYDFLKQYPCTVFLSDFDKSVALLERIRNPMDGVHMLPYMIALMDANLAAKGREFQGTERSTFTAYIMNHLWPEYHPDRVKHDADSVPLRL
ncbi:hypothetical protein EDD11_009717 [Mortierella claussenii]|nr:hypothetical protein EDD11_009717 [Mortierella claussenii]